MEDKDLSVTTLKEIEFGRSEQEDREMIRKEAIRHLKETRDIINKLEELEKDPNQDNTDLKETNKPIITMLIGRINFIEFFFNVEEKDV